MGNDQVTRKLRTMYKYFITSQEIPRWWPVFTHRWYAIASYVLAGLVAAGISIDLKAVNMALQKMVSGGHTQEFSWVAVMLLIVLLAWLLAKAWADYEKLPKRAEVARSICNHMRKYEEATERSLNLGNPVGELNTIYEKIITLVDHATENDAWPRLTGKKLAALDNKVDAALQPLIAQFGALWQSPASDLRSTT